MINILFMFAVPLSMLLNDARKLLPCDALRATRDCTRRTSSEGAATRTSHNNGDRPVSLWPDSLSTSFHVTLTCLLILMWLYMHDGSCKQTHFPFTGLHPQTLEGSKYVLGNNTIDISATWNSNCTVTFLILRWKLTATFLHWMAIFSFHTQTISNTLTP